MLIVEAATSRRYHGLGGAPSSRNPGHHLGEVRTLGEDRGTLDDLASGPVRACKASHQCADYFVFHTSQATPIAAGGPDCKEALPTRGERNPADQPARDPRIGGGDLDLQRVII